MGTSTNQMATVNNLRNNLYYRVDTSKTQYATGTKCVTEAMLTGLASSSTSTAVGRATHTKVNVAPLKISQASIPINSVYAAGLKSYTTSYTLISFTTPYNVGSNTSFSFSETITYTLKLVSGEFEQNTPGTTILSTTVVGTLSYPGGTLDINVQISQNTTVQTTFEIPSFKANLLPNKSYSITLSLHTASSIGINTVTATLTPSVSTATMNYHCHNKLVRYTKILIDCDAEVPFSVKISNAKNVKTKFDTIKLSLDYTSSASSTSSTTVALTTKAWDTIPSNSSKSDVLMIPIRNTSIPINAYQSTLVIWAGTAGTNQDIRIGYEYGTSTIDYESYVSCATKSRELPTYQTPNGLAYLLQDLTGVVYNVK